MITVDQPFQTTASLPPAQYRQRILALPGMLHWFQANPSLITGGASPSTIADKTGGLAVLTQGTAGMRGTLVEGAFGVYPGIEHDGVDDEYLLSPTNFDTNGDFTWVAVFAAEAVGESTQLLSNYISTNTGTFLGLNSSNQLRVRHGSGLIETDYDSLSPVVVTIGKSTGVLRMRINGGPIMTSATDNAGSSQTLRVGRLNSGGSMPFKGLWSDLIICTEDLFADMEQVQLIESFAAAAYGIELA